MLFYISIPVYETQYDGSDNAIHWEIKSTVNFLPQKYYGRKLQQIIFLPARCAQVFNISTHTHKHLRFLFYIFK